MSEGGHRLTFTLRPGITFSDGTSDHRRRRRAQLAAGDRPGARPGPLSGLLTDVVGAAAVHGRSGGCLRESASGPRATPWWSTSCDRRPGSRPPRRRRPSPSFPRPCRRMRRGPSCRTAWSCPVPMCHRPRMRTGSCSRPTTGTGQARRPSGASRQTTSLDGGSVDAFQSGDVDYIGISPDDASWIQYDQHPRAAASAFRRPVGGVLRLRHHATAIRRRACPPGIRVGGRLGFAGPAWRTRASCPRHRSCRTASTGRGSRGLQPQVRPRRGAPGTCRRRAIPVVRASRT